MRHPSPETKIPLKIWISEKLDQRLRVAFSQSTNGKLKFGTITRLVEIALDDKLKQLAKKLPERTEHMEIGSAEWMTEMRRKAAADEASPEEIKQCIDFLREKRMASVGGETKKRGKTAATVTPLALEDLV